MFGKNVANYHKKRKMIYLFIIIFLAICVWIYDFHDNTNGKDICYWGMCILLICIAGFRYRLGIDTIEYMRAFESDIPLLSNFLYYYKTDLLPFEIGSTFLFSFIKTLGGSWYITQFIIAFITNISIFTFANNTSKYKFTYILLYFLFLFFDLNYETLRQALALSVSLYAFYFLKKKLYLPYYILSIIAISFHIIAFILLIIPFLQLKLHKTKFIILSLLIFTSTSFIWTILDDFSLLFSTSEYMLNKATTYLTGSSWALSETQVQTSWKGWIAAFLTYPLQCLLVLYCINLNNSIAKEKYITAFILLWCIIVSLQKILPILYRPIEFVYPFVILIFAEIIITTLKTKFSYKHIALWIFITILSYNEIYKTFFTINLERHTHPRIVSCYPYSNIFTREQDIDRETFYGEVGR